MLSVPHMIVVFVIVLVVFGPQKLPELARGLGKLMAEFRKASTDFKSAFEEEMRDLERQAREVERKKAELLASAAAVVDPQPATLAIPSDAETQPLPTELASSEGDARAGESGMITPEPVPESVPRSTEPAKPDAREEQTAPRPSETRTEETTAADPLDVPHDHQQPA